MEIEQQKREWEEKRLAQVQQEEQEKQRTDKEDNQMLTYSREDALNKVNMRSNKKRSQVVNNKPNSDIATLPANKKCKQTSSNGTVIVPNGISKETSIVRTSKGKSIPKTPPKIETPVTHIRRHTRNNMSIPMVDEAPARPTRSSALFQRATSRKSDRSTSMTSGKSQEQTRSTSESTRSTADSMSRQTTTADDSDSECSLDVMIDSNDVNDSDSNSNQQTASAAAKGKANFDSTSQDDDTLMNDDSTMTDETAIEKMSKSGNGLGENTKITSSPRTRSRGTVKIDLWSLDESPILPAKRQKTNNHKSLTEQSKEEIKLKADFGVRECKVSMVDIHPKANGPHKTPIVRPPSLQRAKRSSFLLKNNSTLDSWLQKTPEPLKHPTAAETLNKVEKDDVEPQKTKIRTRRNTILTNKTL